MVTQMHEIRAGQGDHAPTFEKPWASTIEDTPLDYSPSSLLQNKLIGISKAGRTRWVLQKKDYITPEIKKLIENGIDPMRLLPDWLTSEMRATPIIWNKDTDPEFNLGEEMADVTSLLIKITIFNHSLSERIRNIIDPRKIITLDNAERMKELIAQRVVEPEVVQILETLFERGMTDTIQDDITKLMVEMLVSRSLRGAKPVVQSLREFWNKLTVIKYSGRTRYQDRVGELIELTVAAKAIESQIRLPAPHNILMEVYALHNLAEHLNSNIDEDNFISHIAVFTQRFMDILNHTGLKMHDISILALRKQLLRYHIGLELRSGRYKTEDIDLRAVPKNLTSLLLPGLIYPILPLKIQRGESVDLGE